MEVAKIGTRKKMAVVSLISEQVSTPFRKMVKRNGPNIDPCGTATVNCQKYNY